MTVLLVDVANTVGARPDGWWRDRAGATARLLPATARTAGPGWVLAAADAADADRATGAGQEQDR